MGYNRCPLFIILTEHGFCAVSVIKINPKTELPKLIWSKLDWSETLSFVTILLSPKNHDRNLVISRSLSSDPLNSYFSLINMEIHPWSHLVISFNLESHLAIPLLIQKMCVWSHYDGWPARVEKRKSGLILWVTYPGERNGLIIIGDLPR